MKHDDETNPRRWLQFSLRGLMVITVIAAAFLAGRFAGTNSFAPDLSGSWTANLPAGFQQPTTLQSLGEGRWLLRSRAATFNGTYRLSRDRLTMIQPDDRRMVGLVWKWDGERLVLIAEPPGKPTGQSYLGTVLNPEPKTSP